jgi:hypothetical protein
VGDKPKFMVINNNGGLDKLIIPMLGDLYNLAKSYIQKLTKPGMYEVSNYETTLEILDKKGRHAVLTKKEEVKFLQNNIIAFQDQAWGSGKILIGYKCSPGFPVDFYQFAHKTYVLISLRDVMNKGDITKFNIRWKVKDGFQKLNGFWSTDINHCTKQMKVIVIFPKERPPLKCMAVESNSQRIKELPNEAIVRLPNKRWQVTWEKKNPRLYEHYVLKWEW